MIFQPQQEIPNLEADEVHLWLARVQETAEDQLSALEISRAAKYRNKIDRMRYRTARSILRRVLGGYLSVGPKEIQLEIDHYGKPMLKEKFHKPSLEFNISHSDQFVLVAFARGRRVGVDIERVQPIPDRSHLVNRYFSENESLAINKLSEQEQIIAFYSGWTRKEALLKAIGKGLQMPLNDVEVSINPNEQKPQYFLPEKNKEDSNWGLISFMPAEEYIAAMAVEGQDWIAKSFKFHQDSNLAT